MRSKNDLVCVLDYFVLVLEGRTDYNGFSIFFMPDLEKERKAQILYVYKFFKFSNPTQSPVELKSHYYFSFQKLKKKQCLDSELSNMASVFSFVLCFFI